MTSLQELLHTSTEKFSEKVAIETAVGATSYEELDRQVGCVAGGLSQSGVAKGDRVAWMLPNGVEAVVVTLACYRIGAVAVPMNYRYVSNEVADVLDRVDARIVVYHAEKREVMEPLFATRPSLELVTVGSAETEQGQTFEQLVSGDSIDAPVTVDGDHPALILFTSGSTGRPKGVVHSHAGAYAGIDVSRQIFDFTSEDVILVGKPISHAGGLQTQLMPGLLVGSRCILAAKPSPADAVKTITAQGVTEYGMLASDLLDFIEYLEANRDPLPTLRNSIGSGDAVPTDLHHRFQELLGWQVMEGAGMTEIGGYYAVNPRHGKRKWGSLGLPTPETTLRIVDGQGEDCGLGETGEILIRCPSQTIGYWQDDAATEELFRGGWLHSGDLAHFDEDGYIWFVGRQKLMIVRRGSNIAPAEVEAIIDEHPLVHASVVVGLDDPRDGQVPVACVALLDSTSDSHESAIQDYVGKHLAAYKNPVHYLFLDELPRTGTGKFDRHRLQDLVMSQLGPRD